jgi:protein CpxP
MNLNTSKSVIIAFLASASIFAAGAVTAQPAPPPMTGSDHDGFMRDRMEKHMEAREKALHDALGLRSDQEPAWASLKAAIKPPADDRRERPELEGLTTPERLDAMSRMMAEHQSRFQAHASAIKAFYAQLTAQQRKVFDAMPMMGHGLMRGDHHRRGGDGPGAMGH